MSYFIPTARIAVNQQESFEYAIYSVFGSYFRSTSCANATKETCMRINYLETAEKLQYEMEDICEAYAEAIFGELPRDLRKEPVKVLMIKRPDKRTEIRFLGRGFTLRLIGNYAGKNKSRIKAQYIANGRRTCLG